MTVTLPSITVCSKYNKYHQYVVKKQNGIVKKHSLTQS